MTASAHVLVFRPLIERLRGRGDEVEITARDYAQTLQLLELHGLEATVLGRHGGRSRLGKARALTSRLSALRRWAKGRSFDVALAHGPHEETLQHVGRREDVHALVLPRTQEQRDYVRSLELPSVVVPDRAVDAQSLIAFADVVVSAGGTMNREAVALGVPVYTTYGGRLGGVDEALIRDGRLRPPTEPRAL